MATTFQSQRNLPEKKSASEAALRVCNLLSNAVDEHDKAAAQFDSSQSVAGPRDTKDVRISTVRARRGYGRATRANNAKEQAANKQAGSNDAFMNSAAVSAWTARLAQLRQQIDAAYAQQVAIEQQTAPQPTLPAATASPSAGNR